MNGSWEDTLNDLKGLYAKLVEGFQPGDLIKSREGVTEPLVLEPWSPEEELTEEHYSLETLMSRVLKLSSEAQMLPRTKDILLLVVGVCHTRWALKVLWRERVWTLNALDLGMIEKVGRS